MGQMDICNSIGVDTLYLFFTKWDMSHILQTEFQLFCHPENSPAARPPPCETPLKSPASLCSTCLFLIHRLRFIGFCHF